MFVRNQTTAAAVIAHRFRNRSAPTSKMSAMSRKLTPAKSADFFGDNEKGNIQSSATSHYLQVAQQKRSITGKTWLVASA
jgi:hypothetical protein